MHNKLTRRDAGLGMLALSGTVLMPQGAMALNEGEARALVDKVVGEINRIIASGKGENAMIRDFEGVFRRYGDVPTIARYALGVDARRASAGQMRAFTKAFQGYMARKYGKRFREFIGAKIEVKSARKVKSFYEVKSTARLRGSSPFEVTFLVSDRSGKDLFFNMFIEGINLLLTERTEIGAMLDRRGGNIDQMISDLKRAG